MLFCKKCQTEHEEDKRFCPHCGSFLIKRENLFQPPDPPGETEEKPKEKFICPECHIIYEKMKACIRCGTEVLPFSSYREQKEHQKRQGLQIESEPEKALPLQEPAEIKLQHLICPSCRKEHLGGISCIRCGGELVPIDSPPQTQKRERPKPPSPPPLKKSEGSPPSSLELKEDLPQREESPAIPQKRTLGEQLRKGRLFRKVRRDYPRTILNWSGMAIIAIAAGYFLWSAYSHLFTSGTDSASVAVSQPGSLNPAPSATPSITSAGRELGEEIQIKSLLDQIRLAHLQKDIDLFMSFYSKNFKDREGKKRSTLSAWERYTFLTLDYDLKDLSISGDLAKGRVEWRLTFAPKGGGPTQESRTTLEAIFKKEDGSWKIGEIKSAS